MNRDWLDLMAAIFLFGGPALLGLGALVCGIYLLTKKRDVPRPLWATVLAWVLILVFFGVGACYGAFMRSGFGG